MRNPRVKNIIGFSFLAAFLLLRVVNAHAITHYADEGDTHQCELCELIQVTNDTDDITFDATFEVPSPINIYIIKDDLNSDYQTPVYRFILPDRYLNRPPPQL